MFIKCENSTSINYILQWSPVERYTNCCKRTKKRRAYLQPSWSHLGPSQGYSREPRTWSHNAVLYPKQNPSAIAIHAKMHAKSVNSAHIVGVHCALNRRALHVWTLNRETDNKQTYHLSTNVRHASYGHELNTTNITRPVRSVPSSNS